MSKTVCHQYNESESGARREPEHVQVGGNLRAEEDVTLSCAELGLTRPNQIYTLLALALLHNWHPY